MPVQLKAVVDFWSYVTATFSVNSVYIQRIFIKPLQRKVFAPCCKRRDIFSF